MEGGVADEIIDLDAHDYESLLSSASRDFLLRNNGDKVKIESLIGKKLGFYFSASWCGPCQRFTPALVDAYNEVSSKGQFEVIFSSADEDEESFKRYFSKMPWLAIPFSDAETRDQLDEHFNVGGIPHLVILDENGKVVTNSGVDIIREYGGEAYPFTEEKISYLQEQEEVRRRDQSLRSLLVSSSRDFVLTSDKNTVPISELEGKTVGLYFCLTSYKRCVDFTAKLVEVYKALKEKGENFEVVLIPFGCDEDFEESSKSMPWFTLPEGDRYCDTLVRYFDLSDLPTLVIIGPDGKTLHPNAVEVIEEHGHLGYPFSPERFAELAEMQKAKEEAQTLESILVSGDKDFVLGKDGTKIPVSTLVGKTILLYFSAHWCPPCRAFLPKLVQTYNKIREKDDAFEVVFVSSDRDPSSFDEYFSAMPWLALPFRDPRQALLSRHFKVPAIPMLVAIGPSGRTVTKQARNYIMLHGANAYPFTDERLRELEAELRDMAKAWPEKVKHSLHPEHELVLSRRESYVCNGCEEEGNIWSYLCSDCDFDLHPDCALGEDKGREEDSKDESGGKEGWACDGEVCSKA